MDVADGRNSVRELQFSLSGTAVTSEVLSLTGRKVKVTVGIVTRPAHHLTFASFPSRPGSPPSPVYGRFARLQELIEAPIAGLAIC